MTAGIINFPEFAKEEFLFCPLLDARRMEVYCAGYNKKLETIKETAAEIIDAFSFSELLAKNKMVFFLVMVLQNVKNCCGPTPMPFLWMMCFLQQRI